MDGQNLGRLAATALDRLGDYPSLFFEGNWHTSADIHTRADRVSAGLRDLGVAPGDRVVVMMANCPEVFVSYHAIWRAGAVVAPAIFLMTVPELRHVMVDSGAVAVIATKELLPKVLPAAEGLGLKVIVAGAEAMAGVVDFAELESAAAMDYLDVGVDGLAALLYTGGTTGRSKGVPLTHGHLSEGAGAARSVTYVSGITRGVLALPLAHSFGILVTVGGMHATEPPVTALQRWFDAPGWLALAQQHRAQAAALVPSMLAMLLAQPLEDYDLAELRFLSCGAAPLPAALAREFQRRVPSAVVMEGYGCTETAGIISATPPSAPRPGTVGKPVPGIELRLLDLDGKEVAAGQEGEIVVRGPNVMAGYWGTSQEGPAAVVQGWFATGDIGRLDEDGYLSIVDRKKDLIIRGGYNVFPRDVEDVLLAHPAVASAAVVGREDPRLGEEVVAFVALRPGAAATEEELIAHAKAHLSATKYPREIHVVQAIPLTSVGKVDRKKLRQQVRDA
ncbi:class I adenylate-forming enzyme family protein [Rhizocola hellebori]|nr:AMP-binding protein [Rhizocola hellebori]